MTCSRKHASSGVALSGMWNAWVGGGGSHQWLVETCETGEGSGWRGLVRCFACGHGTKGAVETTVGSVRGDYGETMFLPSQKCKDSCNQISGLEMLSRNVRNAKTWEMRGCTGASTPCRGVCDRRSRARSGEHCEAANGRLCALEGAHKLDPDVLSEESKREDALGWTL
jgi:hypothetical protein